MLNKSYFFFLFIGTCGPSKLERLQKVDKGGKRYGAPEITGLLS